MTLRLSALIPFLIAVPLAAQPTLLDRGREALDHHDAKTAVKLLEAAVAESPQNADAHYLLGVAYGTLAESANVLRRSALARHSRDEFEHAVSLDANNLDARFGLVQYYMIAPGMLGGSEEKALQQANEIAKRDAAGGHRAFGFIDLRHGDYKAAAEEIEAAIALDPNDMPTWFEIGHVAALSGLNLQRGEAALQKYLTYTPKGDEPSLDRALYWLAKIYEREGRRADAAQAYADAQRIAGKHHDSGEARGRAW